MFPTITLFSKEISIYTIMVTVGIIVAGFFACKCAKKRGLDDNDMLITLLIAMIGAFVGAHILYGITNISKLVTLFQTFFELSAKQILWNLYQIFGGGVFYGGLLGGLLVGLIYCKKKQYNTREFSDIAAATIPLFHFFGRIGCFLSGCCYGKESSFGFTYHYSIIESANGVSRIPVQLYEAVFNLIIFAVICYLLKKGIQKHNLLCLYLIMYSLIRFILEFFRGDEYRGFLLCFSTSQWISIAVFAFSAFILIFRRKTKTT